MSRCFFKSRIMEREIHAFINKKKTCVNPQELIDYCRKNNLYVIIKQESMTCDHEFAVTPERFIEHYWPKRYSDNTRRYDNIRFTSDKNYNSSIVWNS